MGGDGLARSGRCFGRAVGHVMTNNFSGYASHSVTSILDRLGSDPVLAIQTNGKAEPNVTRRRRDRIWLKLIILRVVRIASAQRGGDNQTQIRTAAVLG